MATVDLINWLSVVVLIGFLVALGFLIALLYRANRLLYKLDHLSNTFKGFVEDVIPAIVNIGTVTTAVHGVLRALTEERKHHKEKAGKK